MDFNINKIDKIEQNNEQINEYNIIDINHIMNILSYKMNNNQVIDKLLINEICHSLKIHCQDHNKIINDWFDIQYINELSIFKNNMTKFNKLSETYCLSSFIKIID
jgi:hypothetical protein